MGQFLHRWLRLWGLALLGVWTVGCFISCSIGDEADGVGSWNGIDNDKNSFTAQYHIKGKLVDIDTRETLAGMRIISGVTLGSKYGLLTRDTVYTDANGEFTQEYKGKALENYRFIWEDPKGSTYIKDSLEVPVIGDMTNGYGWYLGETNLSVTLEAKKKSN